MSHQFDIRKHLQGLLDFARQKVISTLLFLLLLLLLFCLHLWPASIPTLGPGSLTDVGDINQNM